MHRTKILMTLSKEITETAILLSSKTGYEKEFKQIGYQIWAMKEIYQRIKNQPDKSPEAIIEDFRADMDYYAVISSKSSFVFSVAYDTATYVYDLCIGEVEWDGKCVSD